MSRFPLISNYKDLVGETIEKTLKEMSKLMRQEVQSKLQEEYDCNFSDCFDHPEYLNRILKEFYGYSYSAITETINEKLQDFKDDSSVQKFLEAI